MIFAVLAPLHLAPPTPRPHFAAAITPFTTLMASRPCTDPLCSALVKPANPFTSSLTLTGQQNRPSSLVIAPTVGPYAGALQNWALNEAAFLQRKVAARLPAPIAVDILERDTAYEVTASIPGVHPSEISVTIDGANVLHLRWHKQERSRSDGTAEEGWTVHLKERFETSAWRDFALPSDIDTGNVVGNISNGELHLNLPRIGKTQLAEHSVTVHVTEGA